MTTSSITLQADARSSNPAKEIRRKLRIPGVLYGHGAENQTLECDYQTFHKVFKKAGESTMVDLQIGGKSVPVLIHDISYDPVTSAYTHIDFFAPDMTKEVTANVPIRLVGESPCVKDEGGILIRNRDTLTVKCLPMNLPHDIEVDISTLAVFHDAILVSQVKVPSSVTLQDAEDDIVASVQPPRKEEEITVAAESEAGSTAAGAEGEKTESEGDATAEKQEEKK